MVTHGGIDGFSRLITYLKLSNNNLSETVNRSFYEATQEYGIPSRVRSTENVGIWRFMEEVRGRDCGSYIAGRSVHNSRIERLWRDVHRSVISTYVEVFTSMEEGGIMNPDNEADIFCLHYIFLPRINCSLDHFRQAWNSHPLSTEGNRTPLQLYTGGSIGNPKKILIYLRMELMIRQPMKQRKYMMMIVIHQSLSLSQTLDLLHQSCNCYRLK